MTNKATKEDQERLIGAVLDGRMPTKEELMTLTIAQLRRIAREGQLGSLSYSASTKASTVGVVMSQLEYKARCNDCAGTGRWS